MKCPKCGYNSFEHYDNCKKCSNDLTGYKLTYSISSIVLPLEVKANMAAELNSAKPNDISSADIADDNPDMFAFNEPDASATRVNDDPFNFDEPDAAATKSGEIETDFDPFADLLETTSHTQESPFGGKTSSENSTAVKTADSAQGEFELENFSWDESPSAKESEDTPGADDEFDSFFGDLKDTPSK